MLKVRRIPGEPLVLSPRWKSGKSWSLSANDCGVAAVPTRCSGRQVGERSEFLFRLHYLSVALIEHKDKAAYEKTGSFYCLLVLVGRSP